MEIVLVVNMPFRLSYPNAVFHHDLLSFVGNDALNSSSDRGIAFCMTPFASIGINLRRYILLFSILCMHDVIIVVIIMIDLCCSLAQ